MAYPVILQGKRGKNPNHFPFISLSDSCIPLCTLKGGDFMKQTFFNFISSLPLQSPIEIEYFSFVFNQSRTHRRKINQKQLKFWQI